MAFPDLLTAVVERAAAAVVACPSWTPTPDDLEVVASDLRVLRYHGRTAVPPNCCTPAGSLVATWDVLDVSDTAGVRGRRRPGGFGFLSSAIVLRYVTCWPAVQADGDGETMQDVPWDAHSARLAAIAECVSAALLCVDEGATEEDLALLEETGCDAFSFVGCVPQDPTPGCAGLRWDSYASMLGTATPVPDAS